YYSGKEIKPSVTVKGAVKGTDYTVTYKNCNSVGRASVIINGKDKYTGTVELTFNIKLKKTTAKKNDSTLTWAKVPGADGYEIYYSTGSKYKKLADMGVSTSYDLTKLKSGSYILAVRAYKKTPYGVIYGDLSEGVNVKK
ncbi:MAG: cobalamin biosynthesis protein CobT, partial [Ruminiclostridium sp.]|nr:cobalamin biosynthesis protein CobT [Ruminiclostridium sp.]